MADPRSVDICETRIAVAFNGGVSLAVYESGVALELFRLVAGEGEYAKLSETLGRISVDVITGSSAGAVNSAVLANALVNRGDARRLLAVWRDEGDVDRLLYRSGDWTQRSLLDGNRFREKIFEALLEKRSSSKTANTLQPYVDLFITATNLDGDRVVVETHDGDPITTCTHRQVFQFRYRAASRDGSQPEVNDFRTEEDLCELARAARASAAFPLAFEPVLIEKAKLGSRARNLEADAYHIDGGVLDNRPIALASEAIAGRPADKKVNRILFFVEPDPETIEPRVCQETAKPHSPIDVVVKALVGLPMYQSITSAIREVAAQNERVAEKRATLDYFERVARPQSRKIGGIESDVFDSHAVSQPKWLAVDDRASALYRGLESGYLDLRLKRHLSEASALYRAFQALVASVEDISSDQGASSAPIAPELGQQLSADFGEQLLHALKWSLLNGYDLAYEARSIRYLVQLLLNLYAEIAPRGSADLPWQHDAIAVVNELKGFLYEQEALIQRKDGCEASLRCAAEELLVAMLRDAVEALRTDPRRRVDPSETLERLTGAFSQVDLVRNRLEFLENVRMGIWRRLQNDSSRLLRRIVPPDEQGVRSALIEGYWQMRDALGAFVLRDIVLLPMMRGDDIAAELQPIRLARISPADAGLYRPGLTASDKLAGEVLAHFGAFLSEAWRGNDLTWGRLDAAEIILRRLLPEDVWAREGEAWVARAQNEIAQDMKRRGMGITSPTLPDAPEQLIGRQDLSSVPMQNKIGWSVRAASGLFEILRDELAQLRAARPLRAALIALGYVGSIAWSLLVAAARVALWLGRARWLSVALIAIALMGLGVVLWEHSLKEIWSRLWG